MASPDNIKDFYDSDVKEKGFFASEQEFRTYISDDKNAKDLFDTEYKSLGYFKDYDEFKTHLGLKKKEDSSNGFVDFTAGYSNPSGPQIKPQATQVRQATRSGSKFIPSAEAIEADRNAPGEKMSRYEQGIDEANAPKPDLKKTGTVVVGGDRTKQTKALHHAEATWDDNLDDPAQLTYQFFSEGERSKEEVDFYKNNAEDLSIYIQTLPEDRKTYLKAIVSGGAVTEKDRYNLMNEFLTEKQRTISQSYDMAAQNYQAAVEAGDPTLTEQFGGYANELVGKSEQAAVESAELVAKFPAVYKEQMDLAAKEAAYQAASGGTKLAMQLEQAVKGTYNILPDLLNSLSQLAVSVTPDSEENKIIASKLIEDQMNAVTFNKINTPIYNSKTGEYDPYALIGTAVPQLAQMFLVFGKGSQLLNKAAGLQKGAGAGLFGSSFISTYGENMKEARQAGIVDINEAILYSATSSLIEASLEGIVPENKLFDVRSNMAKYYAGVLAKEGQEVALKKLKDFAIEIGKTYVGQTAEEVLQDLGKNAVNAATNSLQGENILNDTYTLSDFINTASVTGVISLITGGATNSSMLSSPDKVSMARTLAALPEGKLDGVLKDMIDTGQVSPQEAESIKAQVQRAAELDKSIPPKVEGALRNEIVPLLDKRQQLEEEAKTLAKPFADQNKEKIAAIDQEVLKMTGEQEEIRGEKTDAQKEEIAKQKELIAEVKDELSAPEEIDLTTQTNGSNNTEEPTGSLEADQGISQGISQGEEVDKGAVRNQGQDQTDPVAVTDAGKSKVRDEAVKRAESFGYAGVEQAVNSVNKNTGSDYSFDQFAEIPDEELKKSSELSDTAESNKIKAATKVIAEKIRSGKTSRPGLFQSASPGSLIWDATLEGAALIVEAGGTVAEALDKGLKILKESDWYKGLSDEQKAEAEKGVADKIGEAEELDPKREKRRLTQQILNDPKISEEFKGALSDDAIYYDKLPNKESLAEANAILELNGETKAIRDVTDLGNGMPAAVRSMLGQALIKKMEDEGRIEDALVVGEALVAWATDMGQGIQAFAAWQRLTPAGQLLAAQKRVENIIKAKAKKSEKTLTKLTDKLKKSNKEAAEKTVDNLSKEIDKIDAVDPVKTSHPREYGAKNRVITKVKYEELKKALKGKFFSNIPPELIGIAAYHLEATGRDVAQFSKKMITDFGKKVRPYLNSLYDKAKKQLIEDGYSKTDFVQNEEAFEVLSKGLLKETMKQEGVNLRKLIIEHYNRYDMVKRSLSEKIAEASGLDLNEADKLARVIQREFDSIATDLKKKELEKLFNLKSKKSRDVEKELIKLTNLGAFSNDEIVEKYGEVMGWPKLTKENTKEIERLAKLVQEAPEGFKRHRAIQDLLSYQANIPGTSFTDIALSIWYANILSGHKTQVRNFVGNASQAMALYTNAIIQNPKSMSLVTRGFLNGFWKGVMEAKDTLRTGYSPLRGKAEVPPTLERVTFKGGRYNPANYAKYVRRVMVASDVLFFEGLKEMRAYQLAHKIASNEGKENPDVKTMDRALEILNRTSQDYQQAKLQALEEFEEEIINIEGRGLGKEEKAKAVDRAKKDRVRRMYEIIEEGRQVDFRDQAYKYALSGTFNQKPDGLLGVFAGWVKQLTNAFPPAKLVAPFVNVITNVANESINYTPLGFLAAHRGGALSGTKYIAVPQTAQEKLDMQIKAAIGSSFLGAMMLLTYIKGDDDEPLIEITANGTGDYRKNYDLMNRPQGWQPYSIYVAGHWFSYQFTPMMLAFSFLGNVKDYENYKEGGKKDPNKLDKIGTAFGYTVSTFFDGQAMAGVQDFMSSIADPRGENVAENLKRAFIQRAKGFVVPNLYTQGAQEIEKIFSIPQKETSGTTFGSFLKDVPFARNMYSDKINELGEPIQARTNIIINDGSSGPNAKLFGLLAEKYSLAPPPSIKTVTIIDKNTKEERALTQEEYYLFSKYRGEEIAKKLNVNYDKIEKMSIKDAKEEISHIRREATKLAKYKLSGVKDVDAEEKKVKSASKVPEQE